MCELTAFTKLPIVLVSEIMEWSCSPLQTWCLLVDKKTGKLHYRINVKLTAKIVSLNPRLPLMRMIKLRTLPWKKYSKQVTIHIDGDIYPAVEHCLKIKKCKYNEDSFPEKYVEYERNGKMEYLQYVGENCFGNDTINPFDFSSSILHTYDTSRGQYFSQWIEINHAYDANDYTRAITRAEPIEYYHECKELSEEYLVYKEMQKKYPNNSLITEMTEKFYEGDLDLPEIISFINYNYNPYSGVYENNIIEN